MVQAACQPPQRNARPPNDPFWHVISEAFRHADNNRQHLWRLIEHSAIRQEIGLDDAEFKSLEELNSQHFGQFRGLREQHKEVKDKDALRTHLVDVINGQDKAFLQLLAQTSDLQRLIEIDIQAYGARAATHAEVAARMGLQPERFAEIRKFCDDRRRDEMEQMGEEIQKLLRGPQGNRRVRDLFRQLDAKLNHAMKAKLTPTELASLENLKGPAFTIPEDLFDPRRRGSGPGDRQGGPGDRQSGHRDREQVDPEQADRPKGDGQHSKAGNSGDGNSSDVPSGGRESGERNSGLSPTPPEKPDKSNDCSSDPPKLDLSMQSDCEELACCLRDCQ